MLLRPGAIAREDIEKVTGPLAAPASAAITSPGQLESHYAPRATLRLNVRDAEPAKRCWRSDDMPRRDRNLSLPET